MANPAPTINQINAFNATQGTTIDFNIIGGTELVRSNKIYIYDLSDNSLICTHLYVSTESIHELPANTDSSIVYESGKSSADFVNGAQYYVQIQTFTDIAGTEGGSGLSVAKMFWCLVDPTLTITTIPSTISTTSYNVSATYNANTSVVSNIIQQYQFSLYSATGSLLQSSGVVVGSGTQQGTSTAYDISYNFTGLNVGSSYYVTVEVTTTQGMSVTTQSNTFTVSIDTPTLGEATVVNNACDGYISVTSNLSGEYGGSASGDIVSFETDSENVFTKLQVALEPTQSGSGDPSPSNVRPIYGHSGVEVDVVGKNLFDGTLLNGYYDANNNGVFVSNANWRATNKVPCKALTTYVMSGSSYSGGSYNGAACFWDINGNYLGYRGTGANFTSYPNSAYMAIYLGASYVTDSMQIEQGATATDYEPYTKTTVSQEFDVTLTPTVIDETPYLFKQTGDVRGDRESLELVGGSVAWNQLCVAFDQSRSSTPDGSATYDFINSSTTLKSGHLYFISVKYNYSGSKTLRLYCQAGTVYGRPSQDINSASKTAEWLVLSDGSSFIIGLSNIATADKLTSSDAWSYEKLNVIDLTQLLGSTIADYIYSLEQATAGTGVAWFRKLFPKPYYAYNAGELMSVNTSAHNTVGFNQWDEEWEVGAYNSATGQKQTASNRIRSKNKISVVPNATYYVKASSLITIYKYDADENYLGQFDNSLQNATFTIPSDTAFIAFNAGANSGGTYNHDICINLHWDGERDGEYEPYVEHSYPLDSSLTLRGIPKIANGKLYYDGDTYESDGTVTRKYGIVDLGSRNWNRNVTNQYFAPLPIAGTQYTGNHICTKYVASARGAYDGNADKAISITGGNVWVRDTAYPSATGTEFKTAMSGVYLVYELATPTTETAEQFESIQKVSIYGTEEFVSSNGVPVGNKTTYKTRDIFGGKIDLVSGVLTVDKALISFNGTEVGWIKSGTYCGSFYNYLQSGDFSPTPAINARLLCSHAEYTSSLSNYSFGKCFTDTAINLWLGQSSWTVNDFKTFLADQNTAGTPVQLCYELATPQTYQLTPQQIQTLVGQNNVWSEQGDIELSYHIPITNLLVKRQDVADVSGSWLTLYSQPITQASDMDFTFIDFTNQYGKTYKYALVPLLTQTQSGVEVEVEGGYTVSDEVQSIFDGVFIVDSTGSQKCKANVGYGNVDMNQTVGTITPIGAKYPIVITNSKNQYHNGSISGTIVPDDYYFNGNLSRIDMVNKRNELEQFLTNKRAKIIKDWNGKAWLVMIMDNVSCTFNNNYGMGIVNFSTNWIEVGDPTNQEDLQATGLIDVGGA